MKIDDVLRKVLKDIEPTEGEKKKINSVINFTVSKLSEYFKKHKMNVEVTVGGSVAKGTWLKGSHDLDFFIRFPKSYESRMEDLLGNALRKIFKKVDVLLGSRKYYNVKYKGYKLEIVPVLKINDPSEAKNSMDASPFHVFYVKKKIEENPNLAREIRLLKAFAKANGVYGAENYVSGLSGYVSELLIIHYGSFVNLIKALEKSMPRIFIDIEKQYSSIDEILRSLPKSKLSSPIVVIDPTMKKRNAAAALSYRTFATLLFYLRTFYRKPSISAFKEKKIKISELKKRSKKRGSLLVLHKLKKPKIKEDIFFAKLTRKIKSVKSKIISEGISIYDYGFVVDKDVTLYFELETIKLSKFKKHVGPPVWIPSPHFEKFVKKWKNVYVSGTNLAADSRRKFSDVKKFVSRVIREELKNVFEKFN